MALVTWTGLAGDNNWATANNWSPVGKPGASSDVVDATGYATASASIGTVHSITDSYVVYFQSAGTNVVTTFLTVGNSDTLGVDYSGGTGGTSLAIGGLLTNNGYLYIGNATLTSSDQVSAASIKNIGNIYLTGNGGSKALLNVKSGVAGFGVAGVLSGNVQLTNSSAIEFASGSISTIAAGATLSLNGNAAFVEDATALGSNSALKGLSNNSGVFAINNSVSVSTSGGLTNRYYLEVDYTASSAGGSSLTLGGALTNSSYLYLGNATLSASDKITTTGLNNTGVIALTGNGSNQALLNVTGGSAGFGAAGLLTGNVALYGSSAIKFAAGQITTIASNATLTLTGAAAFIEDATALNSNSALAGLSSVNAGGTLSLQGQVKISTAGGLSNRGVIGIDSNGGTGGSQFAAAGSLNNAAGSNLYIGNTSLSSSTSVKAGALYNFGSVYLTGFGTNRALLDVTKGVAGFGVAGILTGSASLAGTSAIEFVSGQISTIAAGGALTLTGSTAFIEDSAALGSNSALTGLTSVDGALFLNNGATASVAGALTNVGSIVLDQYSGQGNSTLTVKSRLTNLGAISIGTSGLTSDDSITAASVVNLGTINIAGAAFNLARLNVTGGAGFGIGGTVTGTIALSGDSAVEFASGQISMIALGAKLTLAGGSAFVEDASALNSNSALKGLANVAGSLYLENQVQLSTTAGVSVSGFMGLDDSSSSGQSKLTIGAKLAIASTGALTLGNTSLTSSDKLTATGLANSGAITLIGYQSNQALLNVTAGAAGFAYTGAVTGAVSLNGDSAVEFVSGQISKIAALSSLRLAGNNAFVEDGGAGLNSNSALKGLTSVAGTFYLDSQASVTTTAGLVNSGALGLDYDTYGAGGSSLSLGGTLTNTNVLYVGSSALSASDKLSAKALANTGTVNLVGNSSNLATLSISGAVNNSGTFNITSDAEELAGAISGAGAFSLNTATLQFDSSVASTQTIAETNIDKIVLKQANTFAATISGFGTSDTIDATSFAKSTAHFTYAENAAGTGGTLTLTSGVNTAHIQFAGAYTPASFALAADGGTGTLIQFV